MKAKTKKPLCFITLGRMPAGHIILHEDGRVSKVPVTDSSLESVALRYEIVNLNLDEWHSLEEAKPKKMEKRLWNNNVYITSYLIQIIDDRVSNIVGAWVAEWSARFETVSQEQYIQAQKIKDRANMIGVSAEVFTIGEDQYPEEVTVVFNSDERMATIYSTKKFVLRQVNQFVGPMFNVLDLREVEIAPEVLEDVAGLFDGNILELKIGDIPVTENTKGIEHLIIASGGIDNRTFGRMTFEAPLRVQQCMIDAIVRIVGDMYGQGKCKKEWYWIELKTRICKLIKKEYTVEKRDGQIVVLQDNARVYEDYPALEEYNNDTLRVLKEYIWIRIALEGKVSPTGRVI